MSRPSNIKMVTTVILENFPSRNEVLTLLDTFLVDNNYPKDYNVGTKDVCLEIIFKKAEVAFDFIKRMNVEKISNHIYNKLKTNMSIEPAKTDYVGSSRIKSTSSKRVGRTGNTKSYERPIERKIHKSASTSASCSILASSPYIDHYQEMKKEIQANKSKWIVNRNFNAYIGKATASKRNYNGGGSIIQTPNFLPLEFRKQDKSKWMSPKNFFV